MNRSMIAGIALAAGVAIAAPALVSAAEEQSQLAQAEPEQHGMGGMRGMMGMMGGGAFLPLKVRRLGSESTEQAERCLAGLWKILDISPRR